MKTKEFKKPLVLLVVCFMLTTSANAQWTRTNGPEGIDINILFKQGNTILAGTQVFGVYRSTDAGNSWQRSNAGIENSNVSSLVYLNGAFYAGVKGPAASLWGVFKSTDDGLSWTTVAGMAGKPTRSLTVKDNFIFAGVSYPFGGLFRSSDFGESWFNLVPESITNVYFIFANLSYLLVSDGAEFIYLSTDNGEKWFLQYQYGSYLITMAAVDSTILTARSHVRSTNNGITWSNYIPPADIYSLTSLNGVFYAGTANGIYKSTDKGDSWIFSGSGISNGTERALLTDGSNLYACVSNGLSGLYKSTNAGGNWFPSSTGFEPASNLRSLISKGSFVFAGMQDNGIYRTSDNGDSWTKMDTTNILLKTAIVFDFSTRNNVVIAGTSKGIFRSNNDGANWTWIEAGLPISASTYYVLSVTASGNNFVAGVETNVPSLEGLYYSSDDGLSWHVTNGLGFAQAVGNNGGTSCLTYTAGLFRSTDSGINWISNGLYSGGANEIIGNGNKWMLSNLFHTYRSTNDGYVWLGSPIPGGSAFTLTQVGDNNVFGGNDAGMFRSQDWGASWEDVGSGLPVYIDIEASCANDRYIFAGATDNAVWKRPLADFGLTGISGIIPEVPSEYSLSQNYPNPFNPETKINYSIPKDGNVTLKIFNSQGKEIALLIDEIKKAGNYSITFNAGSYQPGLSSGIYFYKLSSENFVQTKKMLLIK